MQNNKGKIVVHATAMLILDTMVAGYRDLFGYFG